MTAPPAVVFDIRRFALDDGPGIRTTVFFKGCPLACVWCHNPESIRPAAEIGFQAPSCIGCGACAVVCPEDCIALDREERVDRAACTVCGLCVEACPAAALRVIGAVYPVEELVELLLRDRVFYETSGGGVTFSGGEPTLHMHYLSGILEALKQCGIHTAIQTCGLFDLAAFKRLLLPYLDLIHFDIKLIDPREHEKYTGAGNAAILSNFRALTAIAKDRILPRIPLIPGITMRRENLSGIAALLKGLGYAVCELLPYNPDGARKRRTLGIPVSPEVVETMPESATCLALHQEFLQYIQ